MKLLANENFPSVAVDAMRDAGHDVLWARTDTPGATEGRTAAGSLTPGSSLRGQPGALICNTFGVRLDLILLVVSIYSEETG